MDDPVSRRNSVSCATPSKFNRERSVDAVDAATEVVFSPCLDAAQVYLG
jgi:hypothetical protein